MQNRCLLAFLVLAMCQRTSGFGWQISTTVTPMFRARPTVASCARRGLSASACTLRAQSQPDESKQGSTETLLRQLPPELPPLRILVPACVGSWLVVGTAFFHFHTGWPIPQSFFFAVDSGLSIGFGSIGVTDDPSRLFTIVHVLFGAGVAGAALALYTDAILAKTNEKFILNYRRLTYDAEPETSPQTLEELKGPLAFCAWVLVGVCYGMVREGWAPLQSLYFAVAAMATGGLESPSVDVGQSTNAVLVGTYSLVGVPIFAYNLGNVGAAFEGILTRRREIEALVRRMDKEEFEIAAGLVVPIHNRSRLPSLTICMIAAHLIALAFLARAVCSQLQSHATHPIRCGRLTRPVFLNFFALQVAPDDVIDRAEFIVLELIRLNRVDVALVDLILKRFNMLDVDKDGVLTPEETYLRPKAKEASPEIPPDWSES